MWCLEFQFHSLPLNCPPAHHRVSPCPGGWIPELSASSFPLWGIYSWPSRPPALSWFPYGFPRAPRTLLTPAVRPFQINNKPHRDKATVSWAPCPKPHHFNGFHLGWSPMLLCLITRLFSTLWNAAFTCMGLPIFQWWIICYGYNDRCQRKSCLSYHSASILVTYPPQRTRLLSDIDVFGGLFLCWTTLWMLVTKKL